MPCICECASTSTTPGQPKECTCDVVCSINPNCLAVGCTYEFIPEPTINRPDGGRYRLVGINITDPTCIIDDSTIPICGFNINGTWCFDDCYMFGGIRSVFPEYRTLVTRPNYYVGSEATCLINRSGLGILCCNYCKTECVKDGSVYYRRTIVPCSDPDECCYCESELNTCGPPSYDNDSTRTVPFARCKVGFPLRRRCRDQYCQYICDREGANVYKFRLVKPCPEGCICKPVLSIPYDAECCPATYGSTIYIPCIDDDDPRVNFYCPSNIETCQMELIDIVPGVFGLPKRIFAVRDNCHLGRLSVSTLRSYIPVSDDGLWLFNNGNVEAYRIAIGYLPCACSLVRTAEAISYLTRYPWAWMLVDEGGSVFIELYCGYRDQPSSRLACDLCFIPLGTTIEAICSYPLFFN
jgi:hypothetical protein